jgi:3-methyladenine DNA glycosylase AlkD
MRTEQVIDRLRAIADPRKVKEKSDRFGIVADHAIGVYQSDLKKIAKEVGRNNQLALALFDTRIYEARLLCSKIYDPHALTKQLMDKWVGTFENWGICDSFCMGFFARSEHARSKALEWSARDAEFEKRAGFSIMASYGFANKQATNDVFNEFLGVIEREADDERHYVSKSINWALRNIGKRNKDLHESATRYAEQLLNADGRARKWVGSNAMRELAKPGLRTLDYPRTIYRAT